MSTINGFIKAVYHVYPGYDKNNRSIEPFYFESFDRRLPTKVLKSYDVIDEEFSNFGHELILDIKEISNKKEEEFYFEIMSDIEIRYETDYLGECDVSIDFSKNKIRFIEESAAIEFLDDKERKILEHGLELESARRKEPFDEKGFSLNYEQADKKYQEWLRLYGFILIEKNLEIIKEEK